ncbi:MAG: 3-deoxy-manno-octulosonate cytidylyltransferase [Thermodesulfovibrionales bacterium]|jgi:3-deoxy-manno-octulosonate cytidylyltransferase (CMP-KDO synthetase)
MSAVIVIPARYDSTRFPGKPIALLKGKPLIQHVYENSQGALLAEDVIVATDSETVFETVVSFGGKAVMTSRHHQSGTDRVSEVARLMDYDIIVNVQGDEPLINPQMIDDVISLLSDATADVGTVVKRIGEPEEILDPNVVKVVFGVDGFALYFSRAPIPYHRDGWRGLSQCGVRDPLITVFKHVGIYSYRRDALLRLTEMKPTKLEEIEKLEQLRALEHGFRIKVKEISFEIIGVDTPQDLERVERWLSLSS